MNTGGHIRRGTKRIRSLQIEQITLTDGPVPLAYRYLLSDPRGGDEQAPRSRQRPGDRKQHALSITG